jgi:hypothetical protein
MNVLNIPKQNNHVLRFSPHALKRAHERDVPIPKYIPFNSKLIKYSLINLIFFKRNSSKKSATLLNE